MIVGLHTSLFRWSALAVALVLLLSACGGSGAGQVESRDSALDASPSASTSDGPLASGAALSRAELAAAEQAASKADASGSATPLDELKSGQTAAKSAYASGAVARKAAATRIPVYRFYNVSTGAHFYTASTAERDHVIATQSPPYSLEGEAFSVASAFSPGLSPVHRFYNTRTGVHFYTISEAERANVVATLPYFLYEGVAYYASQVAGQGLIPFYRFYVPSKGFHFYTANESEKASVIANLSATYSYEGVGYYVLDTNWTAEKLPHTGITDQQCFRYQGLAVEACSHPETQDLNPQQDGHRVAINPMSFSQVDGRDLTTCVKDDVTGLVWEGKTDDGGLRDKDNTYTNLGNGASTDASGYVAAVNASHLCGYSDWRLPTMHEWVLIEDLGLETMPRLRSAWFPNSVAGSWMWTADELSTQASSAWVFNLDGASTWYARDTVHPVRLVRGMSHPQGARFTFSTVSYGSDAANNVVNDAWTGLQWRRCEEGMTWNGSTCSGTATEFGNGDLALLHARQQTGWRLPNIKELNSLVDISRSTGARIDPVAFPGASPLLIWSSTNAHPGRGYWFVGFHVGAYGLAGSGSISARLVRVP